MMFASWLGPKYSLPSETQWEFACRGGRDRESEHFGICWNQRGQDQFETNHPQQARFWNPSNPSQTDFLDDDHFVAAEEPSPQAEAMVPGTTIGDIGNGFGIHGMHGNVYEWCLDTYSFTAYLIRLCHALEIYTQINWWSLDQEVYYQILEDVKRSRPIVCQETDVASAGSSRVVRGGARAIAPQWAICKNE